MPGVAFFADEDDLPTLVGRLNADPEVAFIVPDGPATPEEALVARMRAAVGDGTEATFYLGLPDDGYRQRWKAVRTVERLGDGRHSLWHIPAGPLPLLKADGTTRPIPDPWAGWVEERPGADRLKPYFEGCGAEVVFDLSARHRPYSDTERASLPLLNSYWDGGAELMVVSDFSWVGGRRSPRNRPTWRWWASLRGWVARAATDLGDGRHHFWAFPSALRRLKGGVDYYARGWDLGPRIRTG